MSDAVEPDPEFVAMLKIVGLMKPLDDAERVRVLAAVVCMYDEEIARRVLRWWRDSR